MTDIHGGPDPEWQRELAEEFGADYEAAQGSPRIDVNQWTEAEWDRVMRELGTGTKAIVAEAAVYRWRREETS
jgi:hypothetical protein